MRLILLIILLTSCTRNSFDYSDNSGKCFKSYKHTKYSEDSFYLVFNKNNDSIVYRNNLSFYGPFEDHSIAFREEVICPKKLQDEFGIVTRTLKEYGVYNDITNYVDITTN